MSIQPEVPVSATFSQAPMITVSSLDEVREAGEAGRGHGGDDEARAGEGHHLHEAAEVVEHARVRLVVEPADQREGQGRHDAVSKHEEDGTLDDRSERQGGQAQEHVTHVTRGRVTDDQLEVALTRSPRAPP